MVSQLVETTEARFTGIKTRVDSGDLPAISITEFDGILMKRKGALLQAEQLLVQHDSTYSFIGVIRTEQ